MWGVAAVDFSTGIRLLCKSLDLGITFFDTADVYGDGKGETILAEPSIAFVLPNIYNEQQLVEFAAAPDTPRLTTDEFVKVQRLYAADFGLQEASVRRARYCVPLTRR